MVDVLMSRDFLSLNIVVNMDCLNQIEIFDEGSLGSNDDEFEDD